MIAVNVYCVPTKNCDYPVILKWTNFLDIEHPVMFDFFQDCVDQNLILNKFTLIVDGVRDTWRYYATDVAKAEVFQQKFQSMPLNFSKEKFSMQQFWNRHEFDISIDLSLVDLDAEKNVVPLVSKDPKEMWSMTFPLIGPLDHYDKLEKDLQAG
jgi:hypothetical protein